MTALLAIWAARTLTVEASGGLLDFDLYNYYLPVYEFAYGDLLARGPAFWNPFQLCGVPTLPTLQGGLFYPLHVAYLLLPVAVATPLLGLLHLVIVAAATYSFTRHFALSVPAALCAATLAGFLGAYPWLLFFPNILEAAVWLPVGCCGVLALLRRPTSTAGIATLGSAFGLGLLAGYPQMTLFSAYTWILLAVGWIALRRPRPGHALRSLAGCSVAAVLGALLAGVQLVPALVYAATGWRDLGGLSLEEMYPLGWDYPVLPRLLGLDAWPDAWPNAWPGMAIGSWSFASMALLPLTLVLVAVVRWRRREPIRWIVAAIGTLAVLYALGPRTPLFDLLRRLPLLDAFRVPDRALFAGSFAFGVLAGFGFEGVLGGGAGSRRSVARTAAPLIAMATALSALFGVLAGAVAGLVALAAALLAARRAEAGAGLDAAAALLLTAVLTDVAFVGPFAQRYLPDPERLATHEAEHPAHAVVRAGDQRYLAVEHGGLDRTPAKAASLLGLPSIDDYEPLASRRQAEYFAYLVHGRPPTREELVAWRGNIHYDVERIGAEGNGAQRLLDLAAVRYLLATPAAARTEAVGRIVERSGMRRLPESDRHRVLFENPRAVPRAYVVYGLEPAPEPAELLLRISRPDFDPLVVTYLESAAIEPGPSAGSSRSWRRGGEARIVARGLHRVEIEAELDEAGALVLTDAYSGGWRATLTDGRELTIEPANHLFRGVRLPAGRHRVVFEYSPPGLRLGAAASLAGLLGLGLCARPQVARRRRRQRP